MVMRPCGLLCLLWLVSGENRNEEGRGLTSNFDYEKLYGALDEKEHYHNPGFALEVGLIKFIVQRFHASHQVISQAKIISLGCSLALGVEKLADKGFDAYGVDVSPESVREAIAMGRGRRCSLSPCLSVASLASLPFPDNAFPTALSSDVLEHIHPDDVDIVIKEISRVVTTRLFLRIATIPELRKMKLQGQPVQLHLTVKPAEWWIHKFTTLADWHTVPEQVLPASNTKTAFIYLERAGPSL